MLDTNISLIEKSNLKIQSLVDMCIAIAQNLVINNKTLIFPKKMDQNLIKKIISNCTYEQILKIEEKNPNLDTESKWKSLCGKTEKTKKTWKETFFEKNKKLNKKLEEVSKKVEIKKKIQKIQSEGIFLK